MITNYKGKKLIQCDSCGAEMTADTFDEALDMIDDENWETSRKADGYEHFCPDCQ